MSWLLSPGPSINSHSAAQREFQPSYSKKKKSVSSMCAEVWAESTVHQQPVYIGFDMKGLDILCSAAADLQINTFLEAFHVSRLGTTHADATCSYSTSWEALIFKTLGPYDSSEPSSALQFLLILSLKFFFENLIRFCQTVSDAAPLLTKQDFVLWFTEYKWSVNQ